jgi:hypothetical protein
MSQQYNQQGQMGRQQGNQQQGRGGQYQRDPATGQFLDDHEAAEVQRLAQQYPQQVQQAYQQNIPLSAVGLSDPVDRSNQSTPGEVFQEQGGRGQGQQGGYQGQQTQQRNQQQYGQQTGRTGGQQTRTQRTGGRQTGQMQGGQGMGQQQPQQQQGYIPASQEPAGQEPGWPGKQGRGADQGAQDRRHSQQFREFQHEKAQRQPRDPQTGQFLPQGQSRGQQRGQQQQRGQTQQQYGRQGGQQY